MQRREFITLLGGAAVAWPIATYAQQAERIRRVAVLMPLAQDDPVGPPRIAALLQELQRLGWIVGRNLEIDVRWAGPYAENIRKHAAELAALAPDIILGNGSVVVPPLMQATRTVPIVFVIVPDPVGGGFVDSLARPGGNVTGFLQFEYGQREMGGIAQTDCSGRGASSNLARSHLSHWNWSVRRDPVGGTVGRD
jgi:putative ABC transport system substrate-binding protein